MNIFSVVGAPVAALILYCSFFTLAPQKSYYHTNDNASEVTTFSTPGSVLSDDYTRFLYVSKIVPKTFSEKDTEKQAGYFVGFSVELKQYLTTQQTYKYEVFSNSLVRKLLFPFHYFW